MTSARPRALLVGGLPELDPPTDVGDVELVRTATGVEALGTLRALRTTSRTSAALPVQDVVAVVVTTGMPDLNVADFVSRTRALDAELPLLLAVDAADLASGVLDPLDVTTLFAVLVRPVLPVVLATSLSTAERHRRLARAEHDVLRQTLTGVMDVLVETLAVASPLAYRRNMRARLLADTAAERLGVKDDWQFQVAVTMSQIGSFAVPAAVLAKIEDTVRLTVPERQMYVGSLALSSWLLAQIPRMEEIAGWVGGQTVEIDRPAPGPGQNLPRACFGAVSTFLAGYDAGLAPGEIAQVLRDSGRYPDVVVDAVREAALELVPKGSPEYVPVTEVRPGMVLNADVRTDAGLLLMRRGERVTDLVQERLRRFAALVGVAEPIAVLDTTRRRTPRGRAPQERAPQERTVRGSRTTRSAGQGEG